MGREPDEDSGARARRLVGREPRVLERLVGDLEQQTVLRIDAACLARRQAEEGGVELVDLVDESAPSRIHRALSCRIGIEDAVDVEPVGRHLADGLDAVAEQLPELLRRVGSARETATNADDRSRLRHAARSTATAPT